MRGRLTTEGLREPIGRWLDQISGYTSSHILEYVDLKDSPGA